MKNFNIKDWKAGAKVVNIHGEAPKAVTTFELQGVTYVAADFGDSVGAYSTDGFMIFGETGERWLMLEVDCEKVFVITYRYAAGLKTFKQAVIAIDEESAIKEWKVVSGAVCANIINVKQVAELEE